MNVDVVMRSTINGTQGEHIKANGRLVEKDGKYLLLYNDKTDVRTAVLMDNRRVHITRRGDMIDTRFEVCENRVSSGAFGENIFTVVGESAVWNVHEHGGTVDVKYSIPDLGNENMNFCVEIEFNNTEI